MSEKQKRRKEMERALKAQAEERIVPGMTDGVMENCIPVDTGGQVIFRQEQEMLDRIAAMEQKVGRWVDGLQDLNQRISAVSGLANGLAVDAAARKCELVRVLDWIKKQDQFSQAVGEDLNRQFRRIMSVEDEVLRLQKWKESLDVPLAELNVMLGEGKDCEREQREEQP